MTHTTTITEFTEVNGHKVINLRQDNGRSGSLRYANDEATIIVREPGQENDYTTFNVHPEDALIEFFAQFFQFGE